MDTNFKGKKTDLDLALEAAIPELRAKIDVLMGYLRRYQDELQSAEALMAAREKASTFPPNFIALYSGTAGSTRNELIFNPPAKFPSEPFQPPAPSRAKRGTLGSQVREILKSGDKFRVNEIKTEIRRRHNISCGTSSLYKVLEIGKEEGTYKNASGKWFMDTPSLSGIGSEKEVRFV